MPGVRGSEQSESLPGLLLTSGKAWKDPGVLAPTQEWLLPRDRRLNTLGEVGAACESGQKTEVGCEGG